MDVSNSCDYTEGQTDFEFEEELGGPAVAEELQLDDIVEELQNMGHYLDMVGRKLDIEVEPCPPKQPCGTIQVDLYGSQNEEIRRLQHDTVKMQQQLDELQQCSDAADLRLAAVQQTYRGQQARLGAALADFGQFESYKLQMERDSGLCRQRYRHACELCSNWESNEMSTILLQQCSDVCLRRMVARKKYKAEKRKVFDEIKMAAEVCTRTTQKAMQRAKELQQRLVVFSDERPLWYQPPPMSLSGRGGKGRRTPGTTTTTTTEEDVVEEEEDPEQRQPQRLRFTRASLPELPMPLATPSQTWHGRMKSRQLSTRRV